MQTLTANYIIGRPRPTNVMHNHIIRPMHVLSESQRQSPVAVL